MGALAFALLVALHGAPGLPMHGVFACDVGCKLAVCREQALAYPPSTRVNAVAACMDLHPCPVECQEHT